jgi:hypothetical protein
LERALLDPSQSESHQDIREIIAILKSKEHNHVQKRQIMRQLWKDYKKLATMQEEEIFEEEVEPQQQQKKRKKKVKKAENQTDVVDIPRLMFAAAILAAILSAILFLSTATVIGIITGESSDGSGRFSHGWSLMIFYLGHLAHALAPLLNLALAFFGGYGGGGGGPADREELVIYGYMSCISIFFMIFITICSYASPYIRKKGGHSHIKIVEDEEMEEKIQKNRFAQLVLNSMNGDEHYEEDEEEYEEGEEYEEESDDDLPPLKLAKH